MWVPIKRWEGLGFGYNELYTSTPYGSKRWLDFYCISLRLGMSEG